jgi:hypothetical protein
VVVGAAAVGCGSHGASDDVRRCVDRWDGSIAKRHLLRDIARGKEANVRMVDGNCVVTLLGPHQRALTFRGGHPEGYGGFLFAGSSAPDELPSAQRKANADVVDPFFTLKLRS